MRQYLRLTGISYSFVHSFILVILYINYPLYGTLANEIAKWSAKLYDNNLFVEIIPIFKWQNACEFNLKMMKYACLQAGDCSYDLRFSVVYSALCLYKVDALLFAAVIHEPADGEWRVLRSVAIPSRNF